MHDDAGTACHAAPREVRSPRPVAGAGTWAEAPRDFDPERLPTAATTGGRHHWEPRLWVARVDTFRPDLSVLDAGERERARAFRRERDRSLYEVAHVALRQLLGAELDVDPAGVRLARADCPGCGGPHGRPIMDPRHHPAGLHFSLSHAADTALIALAGRPVGVDVEELPSPEVVAEVATALHPQESTELAALPPSARPAAFARCWTRKEAVLKGTGEGLSAGAATLRVGTGPHPHPVPGWHVTDVPAPPGFAAAVAVSAVAVSAVASASIATTTQGAGPARPHRPSPP
ncbi:MULTISPECIES: 4'-phosphopantetheinyl transferase superfamily protein [unclassified Streptomyces]|uniref:4'-phosphopantetheinyl transferase family protein n=1 Tax=unclassified Streptomyces TaxID=2593676 RepID=UPI0033E51017